MMELLPAGLAGVGNDNDQDHMRIKREQTMTINSCSLFYALILISTVLAPQILADDSSATSIAKQYLNSIKSRDFRAAYQLTGKAFRYAISEPDFSRLPTTSSALANEVGISAEARQPFLKAIQQLNEIIYIADETEVIGDRATLLYVLKMDWFGGVRSLSGATGQQINREDMVRELQDIINSYAQDESIDRDAIMAMNRRLDVIKSELLNETFEIHYLQLKKHPDIGKWEVFPFLYRKTERSTRQGLADKGGGFDFYVDTIGPATYYTKGIDNVTYHSLWTFETNAPLCSKCDYQLRTSWKFCPLCGFEVLEQPSVAK